MPDLKPGCILFDSNFKFKDDEIGEKLVVQLNGPREGEPYLFCRTTSKEKPYRRKSPIGCQNSKYFFILGGPVFDKDTWLILDEIFSYNKISLLSKKFNGEFDLKANLDELCLRQIRNCVKKSFDIDGDYMEMIVNTILSCYE